MSGQDDSLTRSPDTKESSETAHRTFRRMLREQIEPALREVDFEGSAGSYSLTDGEYTAELSIETSRHSTRELVSFWVTLSVEHEPSVQAYYVAIEEAMDLEPSDVRGDNSRFIVARMSAWEAGEGSPKRTAEDRRG